MPPSNAPNSNVPNSNATPSRPRRFFNFVARGATATIGLSEIRNGAQFIGDLRRQLETRRRNGGFLHLTEDGRIDTLGSALILGISEADFIDRLAQRRRQTAKMARLLVALALGLFIYWFYATTNMADRSTRLMSLLVLSLFEIILILVAFENAWINWQIRRMRVGSPGEYLRTNEPFLPG